MTSTDAKFLSPTPAASIYPGGEQGSVASLSYDGPGTLVDNSRAPSPTPVSSLAEPEPEEAFTKRQKGVIVACVSLAGLFSSLTINIYIPALPAIARDLHTTESLASLTITVYMIFQGLSPTFWASLADAYGRRPIYISTMLLFVVACIGLGEVNSLIPMLVLRAVQSSGCSSVVSIGAGTVGDITTPQERGSYMGWYALGRYVAPCLGPVIGGILAQELGYHSIFWFLAIFAGVVTILLVIVLPETLPSVIGDGTAPPPRKYLSVLQLLALRRKRAEQKRDIEKGNDAAQKKLACEASKPPKPKLNFLAPYKYLAEWDIFLICMMYSIVYGAFYAVTSTQPRLFQRDYGLNELQIGLTFLPSGVGSLLATIASGKIIDRHYKYYASLDSSKPPAVPTPAPAGDSEQQPSTDAKEIAVVPADPEKAAVASVSSPQPSVAPRPKKKSAPPLYFPIEKARLKAVPWYLIPYVASFIGYGWCVHEKVHISVLLIFQFIIGYTSTSMFGNLNTLLVDLCPGSSASVTASLNLTRCTLGAVATAVVFEILRACGAGWTFVLFGLLCLVVCVPCQYAVIKYGVVQRAKRAKLQDN
ncbi:hypothetical protein BOTBODRAFT_313240 [Botryobasidium botryosum FD-172 SS1]|uniref:Major facilitator superfamily (MFS) profile domain-containing protein n=1 Tax=Botryobasidium botryosum (strain FD-172 SS1) TaxID=930990 RepID=A0A067MYB8_BOTB1|nr:hypothetical protein BOTBODRAFT_313240 [Botryobasidium botryosum FD-172 SS1]